jgi:hypothetical protein
MTPWELDRLRHGLGNAKRPVVEAPAGDTPRAGRADVRGTAGD